MYEVTVDLGWPTFTAGGWWKIAAAVVLFGTAVVLILFALRARSSRTSRIFCAACGGMAVTLIIPVVLTAEQTTPEHRREIQAQALTEESGYRFWQRDFPSDKPFHDESVVMIREGNVQTCSLSTWRKQRWSGSWVAELSNFPWNNTSTVKIQLKCPRLRASP
ncbi:hypothetical protein [Nocardia wallacei]|uniref:hypothetical protein n=1 Tax=Nocardia wallacei TaxID=480035 RepID=UPI002456BCCB|nr:hypothetical protein [Nocardia wallacei]